MQRVMAASRLQKLILLTLQLALFPPAMAVLLSLEEQAGALLAWKATLDGNPAELKCWGRGNTTTLPCSWHGISCSKHQTSRQELITEISLGGLGLRGELHTLNFTALATLTSIQLAHNQIRGSLPPALATSLPNLRHLMLQENEISGKIPWQLKQLEGLVTLVLSNNLLSGPIPSELGYLKRLTRLDLSSNNLIGPIPGNLGNLTKLTIFILAGNRLSGYLPRDLGYLVNLHEMDLCNNKIMGSIPDTFGNLINLRLLYLRDNQLSGHIPRELGNLVNLEELILLYNQLMGSIPQTLGNLTKLTILRLGANQLSGYFTWELGNLVNLELLDLGYNKLMGSIPSVFGNFTKLTFLFLSQNNFSGHIPQEIGNLKYLEYMHIVGRNLSGPLPPNLCAGGFLKNLTSYDSNLSGPLPSSLINCKSLVRVRLEGNQIEGDISKLGVYPNLVYMDMSSNKLFGELSYRWRQCRNLTMLRLSNNNLTGKIPPSMGRLSQLGILDLSSNKLDGELPSTLGKAKSLFQLSAAHNFLHGRIPREIGALSNLELLDLSSNNLSGSIQGSIQNCFKLRYLKLSHNKFNGNIPIELGMLFNLQDLLDLSDNSFIGAIPSQIGGLIMLETLNLSHNTLSGSIPPSFQRMESLTSIDVCYNELEGPIPESRPFQGAPVQWFMHNKMLCGVLKGLPLCSSAIQSGGKRKGYETLVLATVPALISLVLVAAILIFMHDKNKSKAINIITETQPDVFSIWNFDGANTFKKIVEATQDFSEMHCIGTGGYGSVYKAIIATSEIFAVKKIHIMEDEFFMNDSVFNREVEALLQIRHRNVVKLLGYCSSSKGKFLVYEYMERGSLADILKVGERAIQLDWKRRIQLVLDVVQALAYMHHECSSPIVHRDLTSNNILLDGEFRSCISDFGTAKILNVNGLNLTRLAGTKGYLAPELAYTENVTEKCDLYSFGVLVFELFTGTHPGDLFSSFYMTTRNNGVCLKDILDTRLETPNVETARAVYKMFAVAVQCVEPNPSLRPTARHARNELSAGVTVACEDHRDYLRCVLTIPVH